MKKKIPTFKTDAEVRQFISNSDLDKYDLSGLKPVQFELQKLIDEGLKSGTSSRSMEDLLKEARSLADK